MLPQVIHKRFFFCKLITKVIFYIYTYYVKPWLNLLYEYHLEYEATYLCNWRLYPIIKHVTSKLLYILNLEREISDAYKEYLAYQLLRKIERNNWHSITLGDHEFNFFKTKPLKYRTTFS